MGPSTNFDEGKPGYPRARVIQKSDTRMNQYGGPPVSYSGGTVYPQSTGMPQNAAENARLSRPVPQSVLKALQSTKPSFPSPFTAEELGRHVFRKATPDLFTDEDLVRNLSGPDLAEFVGFLLFLNEQVTGVEIPTSSSPSRPSMPSPSPMTSMPATKTGETSRASSPAVPGMVTLLRTIASYVDEVPPLDKTQSPNIRFGNPAFRTWLARLSVSIVLNDESNRESSTPSTSSSPSTSQQLIQELVLEHEIEDTSLRENISLELSSYLNESFGNSTRIDYGTGHETCFAAMLFCMAKLGLFRETDARDIVLVVFREYLETVRKVQKVYCLEPAGTRGVWGLDDYQILPFLWGSAQLVDHPSIRPSDVNAGMDRVRRLAEGYLYFGCVAFIRDIKHGPFHETSPMLFDISGVESWQKINGGMVKMYCAELLGKRTIMQHFLFGSMLCYIS